MLGDLVYRTFAGSKQEQAQVQKPSTSGDASEKGFDVATEAKKEAGHKRLDVSDEGIEQPQKVKVEEPAGQTVEGAKEGHVKILYCIS
jgi:hypothetical protein